jgi:hypothetical protein
MSKKIKHALFAVGVPFVNPSGLDCSTPAVTGRVGHSLRGSHTGIPTLPVRPHSQEQASDARLDYTHG